MCIHIHMYNVSCIEYYITDGFGNWKKMLEKILEKFLSILLKIIKIFFLIRFSVSFVIPEIIDLENRGYYSTIMLMIAINLNQIRKRFKKATKCLFWNFCAILFSTVMRQITNGQKFWWFLFFIFDWKKTNRHPNAYVNFLLKYETFKYG